MDRPRVGVLAPVLAGALTSRGCHLQEVGGGELADDSRPHLHAAPIEATWSRDSPLYQASPTWRFVSKINATGHRNWEKTIYILLAKCCPACRSLSCLFSATWGTPVGEGRWSPAEEERLGGDWRQDSLEPQLLVL